MKLEIGDISSDIERLHSDQDYRQLAVYAVIPGTQRENACQVAEGQCVWLGSRKDDDLKITLEI